jgi:hypothetical protein
LILFVAQKVSKKASADEKSCRCFDRPVLKTAETNQTRLPVPMGLFGPSTAVAQTRFVPGDFCLRPGLFAQNSGDFSKADLRLYGPEYLSSDKFDLFSENSSHFLSSCTPTPTLTPTLNSPPLTLNSPPPTLFSGIPTKQVKKLATFHF